MRISEKCRNKPRKRAPCQKKHNSNNSDNPLTSRRTDAGKENFFRSFLGYLQLIAWLFQARNKFRKRFLATL